MASIQHIQKLLNETSQQVTLFATAHRNRVQSFETIRSQQHEKLAALQAEKNGLINRLETADVSA